MLGSFVLRFFILLLSLSIWYSLVLHNKNTYKLYNPLSLLRTPWCVNRAHPHASVTPPLRLTPPVTTAESSQCGGSEDGLWLRRGEKRALVPCVVSVSVTNEPPQELCDGEERSIFTNAAPQQHRTHGGAHGGTGDACTRMRVCRYSELADVFQDLKVDLCCCWQTCCAPRLRSHWLPALLRVSFGVK